MSFLNNLLGRATNTAKPSGHPILGVKNGAGVDTPSPLQYSPQRTPTPQFSLPQSNLERYGDGAGNQWVENTAGQRHLMPRAPQTFDTPFSNLHYQPIRPRATGYLPVNDATVHSTPAQFKPISRFF